MIDTDKYEGHTENWYVDWPMATDEGDVIIGAKSIGRFKQADAQLIADAPLLLAEVKRLREFRDRVLAAFHEMPREKRSLTYLLDDLGYLNLYSRTDYLEGLHPHALGLYELKDEWIEKAQQYLGEEEE